ncbi:MAG: cell division protein SepF [Corynebacterium sp.]|uniref:cell division protein SepF n=1 Tax=Corynebacterium sp. TaxID=1720 RepID=UPI0026DF46F4|nr:cell division protein SepF [Corynebacterium sp.]MDO5668831.1 cell division protein SepF [Corynebacterium sp.]
MSIIRNAKEFFGLTPIDMEHEDAYYDYDREEPRYRSSGSAAYAPSRDYERDYDRDYEREERPRYQPAPKIVSVEVTSYSQAAQIGEPFRDGDAVVFDMTRMEAGDNKRIVDFAAGLCYALRGKMVNVSKHLDTDRTVFAITPEGADFSQIELERAAQLR